MASLFVHKDYKGLQDMDTDIQGKKGMAAVLQVVLGACLLAEEPH